MSLTVAKVIVTLSVEDINLLTTVAESYNVESPADKSDKDELIQSLSTNEDNSNGTLVSISLSLKNVRLIMCSILEYVFIHNVQMNSELYFKLRSLHNSMIDEITTLARLVNTGDSNE